jgi:hypothetical protein
LTAVILSNSGDADESAVIRAPSVRATQGMRGFSPHPLHICLRCACDLVQPVVSRRVGPRHWQVTLRCPNCERVRTGVFAASDVERFDAALERGRAQLIDDLARVVAPDR